MAFLTWLALIIAVLSGMIGFAALTMASAAIARGQQALSNGRGIMLPPRRDDRKTPYVVYNPTKSGITPDFRDRVRSAALSAGLTEPVWLETTIEDPGTGQTIRAVREGACVVLVAGGDGTVRTVAGALAGTGVPMGLLPIGTANLLARNLDLPLEAEEAIHVAITGRDRMMDIGWLRLDNIDYEESLVKPGAGRILELVANDKEPWRAGALPSADEYPFVVMGGLGFDAEVMASAKDKLKSRFRWGAYLFAGVRHLRSERIEVELNMAEDQRVSKVRARTVLFANCGKLVAEILLLPQARIDDGWLDIAAIDIRGGLLGWFSLLHQVIMQGFHTPKFAKIPLGFAGVLATRSYHATAVTKEPRRVEVDGDAIGSACKVSARVDAGALVVRC